MSEPSTTREGRVLRPPGHDAAKCVAEMKAKGSVSMVTGRAC